jgi:integrase
MAETPATANHALSIMGTLLEFSVARGYRLDNPAIGVKKLSYEADGAHPWSDAAWGYVRDNAPEVFKRLAILGRATGQRRRDLVKLRPADRHLDGFQMRISKLGDKPHFVPLTQAEIREIDSWDVGKLDLYLKNPQNKPYTAEAIGHRWDSWRRPIPVLKDVTIHGLRATAVCDRRMRGIPHHAISAELCMSLRQVMHYSRFIDQPTLARSSRDMRETGDVATLGRKGNGI